ncbi:unnamed protein product [Lampetra fluviatilis]
MRRVPLESPTGEDTTSVQDQPGLLQREDFFIEVQINDYLDVSCPHYAEPGPGLSGRPGGGGGGGPSPPQWPAVVPETHLIYMVNFDGYSGCEPQGHGFKRWNCNRPLAPLAPLKYSEKFQLFTPFSLGFEFQPGQEYYYISTTAVAGRKRCLRLRVAVCCTITPSTKPLSLPGRSRVPHKHTDTSALEQADESRASTGQASPSLSSVRCRASLVALLALLTATAAPHT